MVQAVDSQKLMEVVRQLQTTNSDLTQRVNALRRCADRLEDAWSSRAGGSAVTAMYRLLNNDEARSAVLKNYIAFVQQKALPGYVDAEEINQKLADQFK